MLKEIKEIRSKHARKSMLMLLLPIVFLVLGACGSPAAPTPQGGAAPAPAAPGAPAAPAAPEAPGVTYLNFWHSYAGLNGERLQAFVERFNQAHDHIHVTEIHQGSHHDLVAALQMAVAAGTQPDISTLERAFVQFFAYSYALMDFTPYVEAAGMQDFWNPFLLQHSFFNNIKAAVPFARSTPIMHVNLTMLDEIGMDIPNTWDDMWEVANALVIRDGDSIVRSGLSFPYDTWYFLAMMRQAGGSLLNADGTAFEDAAQLAQGFQFARDLEDAGALIYPPPGYGGDFVNQLFIQERVGMVWQSTGTIGSFQNLVEFEYTTAYLPMNVMRSTPTGGANIVILEASDNHDESWTFIEWIMRDPEGLVVFISESGFMPPAPLHVESPLIQDLWERTPMFRVAYDHLRFAEDTNLTIHWPEIMAEMFRTIEAIMYDHVDIETEVARFQRATNQILAQ